MGDRGVVCFKQDNRGKFCLYTHWGASDLIKDVRKSLLRKWRWDDPSYLARIIFEDMIPERSRHTETGYGIMVEPPMDAWRQIWFTCNWQEDEFHLDGTREMAGFKCKIDVEDNNINRFSGDIEDYIDWSENHD